VDEFEIELGKECARPNMRNVNVKNGESSIEYKPEKCPFKEKCVNRFFNAGNKKERKILSIRYSM
jgi:hypothetical protein